MAQRFDDVVLNRMLDPVPGALVTVYLHGTTTLATLVDGANAPLANPVTADALGNFFFYAAPGTYDLIASGGAPAVYPSNVNVVDIVASATPTLAGDSDVLLTTPANGDLLTFDSVSGLWKNKPTPPPDLGQSQFALWTAATNPTLGGAQSPFLAINDLIENAGAGSFAPVDVTGTTNFASQKTGNGFSVGTSRFYGGRPFSIKFAGGVSTGGGTSNSYQCIGLIDTSTLWFVTQNAPVGNFALFLGNAATWQCVCSGGASITTVDSLVAVGARHSFSIKFIPGVSLIFQIDGVTVATITTNLPTSATPLFAAFINNRPASSTHTLTLEYLYITQPTI